MMIVKKSVLLMGYLFFSTVVALADSREDSARLLFNNQQYQASLDIWYAQVNAGHQTSGIYYNIGEAESKLNHVPEAMIAFEKALRLKPYSGAIQAALSREREKIENAAIPVKPFFLVQWYRGFLGLLRPGYWAFAGLMILVLTCLVFILRLRKPSGGF